MGVCTKPENPICIVEEALTGSLLDLLNKGLIEASNHISQIALDIASGSTRLDCSLLIFTI